jgi:hypothetical protein
MVPPVIPATPEWKQEDQDLEAIPGKGSNMTLCQKWSKMLGTVVYL